MKKSAPSTNSDSVLVTLADKNFIDQAKQLFSSAYWNGGWQGDYLLLAHEIPEEDLRWFREKGIMVFPAPSVSAPAKYGKLPDTILDKFYLFTPYFKQWRHVIFLDADIIVRASLDALTRSRGLAAAADDFSETLEREFRRPNLPLRREYRLRSAVFNSGVMAIDTELIRDNTFDELRRLSDRHAKYVRYGEQAILNLLWHRQWRQLPMTYNFLVNHGQYRGRNDISRKAAVLHFAWRPKPWDAKSEFHEEWLASFRKADAIDLRHIPSPTAIVSALKAGQFDASLQRARIQWRMRKQWRRSRDTAKRRFHQTIYRTGRVIKSISPRLYYGLGGKD